MAGGKRKHRTAAARAAAVAVGHPGHRDRRGFDTFGHCAQGLRVGFSAVVEIERGGIVAQQQGCVGQPGIGVGRRQPRHRHRALRQFVERGIAKIGRTDRGRTTTGKHAQPDMFGFGTLDIFERAQPHRHALRGIGEIERVAMAGAGGLGPAQQRLATVAGLFGG